MRATLVRRLRQQAGSDEGFTLVEILAAMIVFAVASTATAGMLVTGLRSSMVAKLDTGAKNLAQERLEIMRNLPLFIEEAQAATPGAKDDLLNHYYTNTTAATSTTTDGYVAAGGAREAYEPAGAFYRKVFNPVPGYSQYRQYIATQFVDENRNVLTPPAGYNSHSTSGADVPPSQFVFVSVATYWTAGTLTKRFVLQSYIASARPAASQITLQSRLAALTVSTSIGLDALLTYQAGIMALDGALASGSFASGKAQGAFASISGGQSFNGALYGVQAPPSVVGGSSSATSVVGSYGGRDVLYFANTLATGKPASVTQGLPNIGSSSDMMSGRIVAQGAGQTGVWVDPANALPAHLMLDLSRQIAWVEQSGGASIASASGHVNSTAGVNHQTLTGASGQALAIRLFPTTFAPAGVVQLQLSDLSLNCAANGKAGGAATSLSYTVELRYWNGASYTTVYARHTDASDPFASIDKTQVIATDYAGQPISLGEYISDWGSLAQPGVTVGRSVQSDGRQATASYAAVASLTTIPLRTGDPTSALSIELGQSACTAGDYR